MLRLTATMFLTLMLVFNSAEKDAKADQIDAMVEELNSVVSEQDVEKFAQTYANFSKLEQRFKTYDHKAGGRDAATFLKKVEIFGDYVSHAIVKKQFCGERIARVITVFFAESGQYAFDYWFFKPRDIWVLTSFKAKGQGGTQAFIDDLSKLSSRGC